MSARRFNQGPGSSMEEHWDGRWVRAEDYDRLFAAARAVVRSNPMMTGKPQITIDADAFDALSEMVPLLVPATPEDG